MLKVPTTIKPILVATVVLLLTPALRANTLTYDLGGNWSNSNNPNGVWSYRAGSTNLPLIPNFSFAGSLPLGGPAWAPSNNGGNFLPAWFQAVQNSFNWQVGDIVVHSTDQANGVGQGVANILWTAPVNGTINITGDTWLARSIGRGNDWAIYFNGNLLSSGVTFDGNGFTRANPFVFSNGSGGALALQNLTVNPGDTVQLVISQDPNSAFGDFNGVNLQITETSQTVATPESSSLILLGSGLLGLCGAVRRKFLR
jgi:hypothetical protein